MIWWPEMMRRRIAKAWKWTHQVKTHSASAPKPELLNTLAASYRPQQQELPHDPSLVLASHPVASTHE